MVDTFIRRPILASVCSLVLILAGAVAIPTMPVAQYPSLASPQVNVIAIYTGANAQEVETAVTTPLEQRPTIEWGEKVGSLGAGSPSSGSPGSPGAAGPSGGASATGTASPGAASGSVQIGGGK